MAVVGIVAHDLRPAALELQATTATWLRRLGHEARLLGSTEHTEHTAASLAELDLAVSMGGDGTMLRTVRLVAPCDVPVLGVNLGHLGYLTVVEPDRLSEALERFLAGDHGVDARMTLDVVVRDPSGEPAGRFLALNDVVLQRAGGGHTVRLAVELAGKPFVGFAADAVIVATPTGSTAYNLSARGPIVSPSLRAQILTPVAPHSLFDRSLILGADEPITIVAVDDRSADLVVDGIPGAVIESGQRLEVRGGARDARLVTFGQRSFEEILLRKFNLPEG